MLVRYRRTVCTSIKWCFAVRNIPPPPLEYHKTGAISFKSVTNNSRPSVRTEVEKGEEKGAE